MYRGYQMNVNVLYNLFLMEEDSNRESEVAAFKRNMNAIRLSVNLDLSEDVNFEDADGNIDAGKLVQKWFPVKEYDVFISHSHADKENAVSFAVWLQKHLGLKVFVGSTVWGYSEELLKELDDEYCFNKESGTYDYNKRNVTTAHVHLMLAMTLQEMINKSECFIFLNSSNSLSLFLLNQQLKTKSPWIFEELKTTSIIGKIPPTRSTYLEGLRRGHGDNMQNFAKEDLNIIYPVGPELNKLAQLTTRNLKEARMYYGKNKFKMHGLDALYSRTSLKISD